MQVQKYQIILVWGTFHVVLTTIYSTGFSSDSLRVAEIAVVSFATLVEKLLIDFLRAKDNQSSDWYEEFWTGASSRYCLSGCHAGHCGSNNNIGVEVDWLDVRKQHPTSATTQCPWEHFLVLSFGLLSNWIWRIVII